MRISIFIFLLIHFCSFGQKDLLELTQAYPDSARNIAFVQLEKSPKIEKQKTLFRVIAQSYYQQDEWDSALIYLQKEDSLNSISTSSIDQLVENKQLWASSLYNQGFLVQADSVLQNTLSLLSEVENYKLKASVLLDAGWLARERGRHAEALEVYFKAKTLSELNKDEALLAECYSKIAVVYHVKLEFEKAKENYDKALFIYQKQSDQEKIARLYNNYGLLYQYQGYSTKAVNCFERSIEMCDSLGNSKGVAIANENLGILCYEDLENYPLALNRFQASLDYWRSTQDIYGQSQTMVYMLFVYELQKNYTALVDSGLKALELSQLAGAKDVERDALILLSKGYDGLGASNKAFSYYKQHIRLRDSLQSLNKDEEIKLLGLQNEMESKQIQDSLNLALQHEQESAEIAMQVKEQRFWTGLSLSIVIALIVIIFLLFRGSQQRKKAASLIEETNQLLQTKNSEIIDSITYAKRIQEAILPTDQIIKNHLGESFVYYLPKDIVAGDFYWIEDVIENGQKSTLFAVADCTGHGVPGAMVSVICANALNKAVNEMGIYNPSEILEEITKIVVKTFEKSDSELKDGMDISLVKMTALENGNIALAYAGANNPLWIVKDNSKELLETKATKRPIGKNAIDTPFVNSTFELSSGDMIYLFTDGYADQFGGEKNKKFKYKTLKNLLIQIANKPVDQQKAILNQTFNQWKGGIEQVDDVCISGIRV
ncbi:MAG: tetratricopeptide repeat protein [Crocinitomicaceae bacterium]